jgi:hypothetical protein
MAFSTFLPENKSCGSAGQSFHVLLDTYTGLPSPVMGSTLFGQYNPTQETTTVDGMKPISDHYGSVEGMNVQTTVVTTYINGRAKTAFVTTSSAGKGGGGGRRHSRKVYGVPLDPDNPDSATDDDQSYIEPVLDAGKGVMSWREVLDYSIQEISNENE